MGLPVDENYVAQTVLENIIMRSHTLIIATAIVTGYACLSHAGMLERVAYQGTFQDVDGYSDIYNNVAIRSNGDVIFGASRWMNYEESWDEIEGLFQNSDSLLYVQPARVYGQISTDANNQAFFLSGATSTGIQRVDAGNNVSVVYTLPSGYTTSSTVVGNNTHLAFTQTISGETTFATAQVGSSSPATIIAQDNTFQSYHAAHTNLSSNGRVAWHESGSVDNGSVKSIKVYDSGNTTTLLSDSNLLVSDVAMSNDGNYITASVTVNWDQPDAERQIRIWDYNGSGWNETILNATDDITSFDSIAINNSGSIIFKGWTSANTWGLFSGLDYTQDLIALEGSILEDGYEISSITFNTSGLNDQGEFAFFANGDLEDYGATTTEIYQAVYKGSIAIPEPITLLGFAAIFLFIVLRRRLVS